MVDSAPVLVERAAAETPEAFGMAGMDVGGRWRVQGAGGGGSKVDGGTWDAVGGKNDPSLAHAQSGTASLSGAAVAPRGTTTRSPAKSGAGRHSLGLLR